MINDGAILSIAHLHHVSSVSLQTKTKHLRFKKKTTGYNDSLLLRIFQKGDNFTAPVIYIHSEISFDYVWIGIVVSGYSSCSAHHGGSCVY